MKKLISGLALLVLAVPLTAQNRTSFAGVRNAIDYAYGAPGSATAPLLVDVGNTTTGAGSSIILTFGNISLPDGTIFMPFSTNAPITVGIGTNAETVTPTGVSCGTPQVYSTCVVTANLSNTHGTGDFVGSGTFGLQEALNSAHGKGGAVAISGSWSTAGGTTAMVTAAVTYANAGIFDYRAGSENVGSTTLSGSCTGTATSSATLGLLGLGQFAIGTCTSTVVSAGQITNHTGILRNLSVSAGTAGVSSSAGVFTVLKNGSTTTLTCTVGTGTGCTDITHTAAFVAGDIVGVEFTTQATETLANVKASVLAY